MKKIFNYSPDVLTTARRNQDILILCFLTLLAVATRVYGIWEWSLTGDEYFTVTHAEERATSLRNPASYALVVASTALFGHSEWSVRLPFVILGVLSIPIFYLVCRPILGKRVAVVGSLLIIFSGWHLLHSQWARYYSGVFLFGTLSYYLYYQAARKDSYYLLAGTLAANLLGFLFSATFIMVSISCAIYSALIVLWRRGGHSDYSRRVAASYLAVCCAAVVVSLPFFWKMAVEWNSSGSIHWAGPLRALLDVTHSVSVAMAISAFFGLLLMLQKDFVKGSFFTAAVGVPFAALLLASAIIPPVNGRYIFYTLPLIISLSAYLCVEISSALSRYRFGKYAVVFLVVGGMMPGFVSHYSDRMSLDERDAAAVIERRYEPGDKIMVRAESIRYNFKNDYPTGTFLEPEEGETWTQVLARNEQSDQRVWIIEIVFRNRGLSNKDIEGWLMENASLVWRAHKKRYDYTMTGFEIYLANGRRNLAASSGESRRR